MANQEQLNLLKNDRAAWNRWRESNPSIRPDLREADLRAADLTGADLFGAKLQRARLHAAILFQAKLHWADLQGADLQRADLRSANLQRAKFQEADLRDVNLAGADLFLADLRQARLHRADLSGADLQKTDLQGADLHGADLRRATFRETNFQDAQLQRVNLQGADLHDADLFGVQLHWAQLQDANLQAADLSGAKLQEADLERANLAGATLAGAKLQKVNLHRADLSEADLHGVDLSGADLSESNLSRANLREANMHESNLREATLREADLRYAQCIQSVFEKADLTGCAVYGISAWDMRLDGATQDDLVISRPGDPVIQADRLEVAQLIYLFLNYNGLDTAIDEMTSKVVLVVGHFIADRKAVLGMIREELRQRGYLTLTLDVGPAWSSDFTRTVATLARLSRFIVVDITESRGVHPALGAISPFFDVVPTRALLQITGSDEDVPVETVSRLAPVMIHRYTGLADLRASFDAAIVSPAEAMRAEQ